MTVIVRRFFCHIGLGPCLDIFRVHYSTKPRELKIARRDRNHRQPQPSPSRRALARNGRHVARYAAGVLIARH